MFKFNPANAERLLSEDRAERLPPDQILDRLPLSPAQTIADVGCGPGYFTIPLARAVAGGTVYALDTEQPMLDRLQARVDEAGLSNVVVARSTETSLPLEVEALDGVFVAFVLHEAAENRVAFLDLIARHTRTGGWLAVLDWHRRETPIGPPLDVRLEPNEVLDLLRQSRWEPDSEPETVGEWFHFVLARRTP